MQPNEVARTEKAAYGMAGLVALVGLPFIAYFFTQPPRVNLAAVGVTVAIFAATVLILQREIARNACLLRSDLPVLVKFDMLYFTLAMLLAGAAIAMHQLTFVVAVLAFAVPALLTRFSRPQWPSARTVAAERELTAFGPVFWGDVTQVVRWAVPGVIVTWLFSNGYWFILEHTQDAQTVATIGASRLLFTPIGLLIQGWLMQLRPLSIAMAHDGKMAELRKTVVRQSMLGIGCVLLVTAVGYALVSWCPQVLPRSMRAPGVDRFLFVWGIYFALFWFRSGISTLLLTKASGFKTVFFANLAVCAVFYALFFASLNRVPLPLSLASLIGAELLMIYLLFKRVND
jgi:hypothetical protein